MGSGSRVLASGGFHSAGESAAGAFSGDLFAPGARRWGGGISPRSRIQMDHGSCPKKTMPSGRDSRVFVVVLVVVSTRQPNQKGAFCQGMLGLDRLFAKWAFHEATKS